MEITSKNNIVDPIVNPSVAKTHQLDEMQKSDDKTSDQKVKENAQEKYNDTISDKKIKELKASEKSDKTSDEELEELEAQENTEIIWRPKIKENSKEKSADKTMDQKMSDDKLKVDYTGCVGSGEKGKCLEVAFPTGSGENSSSNYSSGERNETNINERADEKADNIMNEETDSPKYTKRHKRDKKSNKTSRKRKRKATPENDSTAEKKQIEIDQHLDEIIKYDKDDLSLTSDSLEQSKNIIMEEKHSWEITQRHYNNSKTNDVDETFDSECGSVINADRSSGNGSSVRLTKPKTFTKFVEYKPKVDISEETNGVVERKRKNWSNSPEVEEAPRKRRNTTDIFEAFEIQNFFISYLKFTTPLARIIEVSKDAGLHKKDIKDVLNLGYELMECYGKAKKTEPNAKPDSDADLTFTFRESQLKIKKFEKYLWNMELLYELMYLDPKLQAPWASYINPNVDWNDDWTRSDDAALLKGIFYHGRGNWEPIMEDLELNDPDLQQHLKKRARYLLYVLKKHWKDPKLDKPCSEMKNDDSTPKKYLRPVKGSIRCLQKADFTLPPGEIYEKIKDSLVKIGLFIDQYDLDENLDKDVRAEYKKNLWNYISDSIARKTEHYKYKAEDLIGTFTKAYESQNKMQDTNNIGGSDI